MTAVVPTKRIATIDIARFYAIALVFMGHFVEELMLLKNPAGMSLYKFIYSFHMLLFAVLAGYVAKEEVVDWPVAKFIDRCFTTRLLPFIFLTLVMMIPPLFFEGKFFGLPLPSLVGYFRGTVFTVFGLPSFCVPSWFLLMIIGVEIVHYAAFRYLKTSDLKILIAALLFYVAGYWLNLKLDIFNPLKGRIVGWNYLFIHGAITLYAFYLLGILLRRRRFLVGKVSIKRLLPAAVIAFLAVLFTYQLNDGPFNFHVYNYVVIMFASYGHFLLFPFTAIAGCALILLLSRMTRAQKTIVWLGQNTMLLMFLNGIFYHYINPPLAKWVLEGISSSGPVILILSGIVTLVSLALCMPLVYLFNTLVPQLVGKPKLTGLILKKPLHFRWLPPTIYILFLFLPLLPLVSVSLHVTLRGGATPVGEFTLSNYIRIFQNPVLTGAILNSIAYVTLNILITIPVALLAAYAFSRYTFVGDKHLFFGFLAVRMTPPVVMVLPVFLIFLQLDLVNKPLGIALAHCAFNVPISIWVLESFFSAIPKEFDETALLDGYSFLRFFVRIMIPLMAPGIAVAAFFCFMFSWVEIVFARVLTVTSGKPIGMAISTLFSFRTDIGLVMAMTVLSIIPGVLMICFARNHIAKGFTIRAGS
ncbi:MAG: acyltransferase family protein [Desulfosarcinaceae bacterium]|nr:acyltransferase family protein [Desulfosarcinaceae bacterium]